MNSDRRHELQENELASILGRVNQSIDPYSKPIAIGVAAAFIGLLGWGFYSSVQSDQRSDATLQLIDASVSGDADQLATVAAQYPGTSAAAWSRLYQGSQKMGVGINSLFNSRDEAEELLGEATTAYREALKLSDETIIQSRAHFGIAKIAESLGNIDEAIESYEAAMAVGESDAIINESKQRIELLSTPTAKNFIAWFGEQDFSPADPSLPPSLPGAGTLPDLPDLNLPELDLPETSESDDSAPMAEQAAETQDTEAQEPETQDSEASTPQAKPAEGGGEEMSLEKPAKENSTTAEPTTGESSTAGSETTSTTATPETKTPAAEKPVSDE